MIHEFPFQIGGTSYLYPGEILENVERFAHRMDNMQLLVFEYKGKSSLPPPEHVPRIRELALEAGLEFTVHLPQDIRLWNEQGDLWQTKLGGIMDALAPLDPRHYIIHIDAFMNPEYLALDEKQEDQIKEAARREIHAAVERLEKACAGRAPVKRFCIENLNGRFQFADILLDATDASLCLDAGHAWIKDADPCALLKKYAARIRAIHLHGVTDGKDHLPLLDEHKSVLRNFMSTVKSVNFNSAIILEVFDIAHFEACLNAVETAWEDIDER